MPKSQEPPVGRGTKIRAGLPGEDWRRYISAGAERSYDTAPSLVGQREAAKTLRKKGRLIEAHRQEKNSYRIRARGYDRRKRGVAPVEKALTREVRRIGPYAQERLKLTLKKPTKWERTNDTIRAVGSAIGPFRTVAALGGGAGIAATVKDKQEKAKKFVTGQKPDTESKVVGKSLTIDDINGYGNYLPVVYRRMDIDTINKSWDDYEYQAYLEEIIKMAGLFGALKGSALGKLGTTYGRAANVGFQSGGLAGAQKALGQVSRYTGGWQGAGRAAKSTWNNPAVRSAASPGALSTGQKTAAGIGAGALGAAGLTYGAYRMAKPMIRRKAKKAALYGALGLGGTVAAGTALGSAVGNR